MYPTPIKIQVTPIGVKILSDYVPGAKRNLLLQGDPLLAKSEFHWALPSHDPTYLTYVGRDYNDSFYLLTVRPNDKVNGYVYYSGYAKAIVTNQFSNKDIATTLQNLAYTILKTGLVDESHFVHPKSNNILTSTTFNNHIQRYLNGLGVEAARKLLSVPSPLWTHDEEWNDKE